MKNVFKLVLIGLLIFGCSNDDDIDIENKCDFETVISEEQFSDAPADHVTINSLEINGNCLKINFSSSGCSGDAWEVKLFDSEAILESNPLQRNLRLSLKRNEACLAYFTKELTFDISNLQTSENQIQLNITNSEEHILYNY